MELFKKKATAARLFLTALSFLAATGLAAAAKKAAISEATLMVPAAVLEKVLQESLPFEIEKIDNLTGKLWVRSIQGLRLGENAFSFKVRIRGENVAYTRKIAGYPAVMEFGRVDLFFDCMGRITYHPKRRLLTVKPRIRPAGRTDELLTPLLMALVNESEYVVQVDRLDPIKTRLGGSPVVARMEISSIRTSKGRLWIGIVPRIQKGKKE